MEIRVRHEAATQAGDPEGSDASPERTCVWIVEDGVTQDTRYLAPGEEATINVKASLVGDDS